jgi:hypothetical protein
MGGNSLSARNPLVFDVSGEVFDKVRAAMPGLSVYWVREIAKLHRQRQDALALLAAYDGIEWLAAWYLQRRLRTVVLTAKYERAAATKALERGRAGYLDARLPAAALSRALLGVLDGEPAYPRALLGSWIEAQQRAEPSGVLASRTARQSEILALIAQGAADKQPGCWGSARQRFRNTVAHFLDRLGVLNRRGGSSGAAVSRPRTVSAGRSRAATVTAREGKLYA